MTGNAISNLSKAVEVYTRHPTNMTHYQVQIIMIITIEFACNPFLIVTISIINGFTHVEDIFLAGYQEVGVDKQLNQTFHPRLSSAKVFVKRCHLCIANVFHM